MNVHATDRITDSILWIIVAANNLLPFFRAHTGQRISSRFSKSPPEPKYLLVTDIRLKLQIRNLPLFFEPEGNPAPFTKTIIRLFCSHYAFCLSGHALNHSLYIVMEEKRVLQG
ncbi:hypothetical protein D3C77_385290 [compost metagenome]